MLRLEQFTRICSSKKISLPDLDLENDYCNYLCGSQSSGNNIAFLGIYDFPRSTLDLRNNALGKGECESGI